MEVVVPSPAGWSGKQLALGFRLQILKGSSRINELGDCYAVLVMIGLEPSDDIAPSWSHCAATLSAKMSIPLAILLKGLT